MPAGEAFTSSQRQEIAKSIADAERLSGFRFSVYVGPAEGEPRPHAMARHAELPDPHQSVLVHVDPTGRSIEIVTGEDVKRSLDNHKTALAALTMQSTFASGDLTRGLIAGVQQLAGLARRPAPLHTDTP